jgi:SagB-type dehydrogenase family enzyme
MSTRPSASASGWSKGTTTPTRRPPVSYRRSRHIVAYWAGGGLLFHNYALGNTHQGDALTIALLDFFDDWRRLGALTGSSEFPAKAIEQRVQQLTRAGFLQRSDRAGHPREAAYERHWSTWNPSAGFFHSATRDSNFAAGEPGANDLLRARVKVQPQPPRSKSYPEHPTVSLPAATADGSLARVLLERRTWRRFGDEGISAEQLATLLGLSFGVQKWIDLQALGRAMLRTSPSGGARNPIEAYVVAGNVTGLGKGLYHYAADSHQLALLRRGRARARIERYLPGQRFFASASALVIMTAVFPRTEWQYRFPRAYRVVHLEAGHFCQTFCLVATGLGLAPFCTAALADSIIERDLGIDGVSESVVYACGVGTRPPGTSWAPLPDTTTLPRVFPPKHRTRARQ